MTLSGNPVMTMKLARLAAILATTSLLGACAAGDRLAGIGICTGL